MGETWRDREARRIAFAEENRKRAEARRAKQEEKRRRIQTAPVAPEPRRKPEVTSKSDLVVTPAPPAAVAKPEAPPRQRATLAPDATPAIDAALARDAGYTRIPNAILDGVLGRLEPIAALVYLRLYRLSHGFGEDTCTVGYPALAKAVHASERAVRYAVAHLEDVGLVERVGAQFGGAKAGRGNTYRVRTQAAGATPARDARAAPPAANKESLKDMTQTDPVQYVRALVYEHGRERGVAIARGRGISEAAIAEGAG